MVEFQSPLRTEFFESHDRIADETHCRQFDIYKAFDNIKVEYISQFEGKSYFFVKNTKYLTFQRKTFSSEN